uniref:Serpentine Receptor, class H n=2 Tax=Caenorhabditis tropicalis TaxID=1561998 RepID=A0A1I7T6H9_9PELO
MNCTPPPVGYFESPEFLTHYLHSITAIATVTHCFGLWMIIFKTPEQMSTVKWYLFNLQFWIIAFDISVGFLSIPFMLLPRLAGFPLGVASYFGISTHSQTIMILHLLGLTLISTIAVFENRFNALCTFPFQRQWKIWRRPFLLANLIALAPVTVPCLFMVPEQSEAKKRTYQNLPCLPKYIYEAPVFVLSENHVYVVASVVTFVVIIFLELAFFFAYLLTNTLHQMNSRRISVRTFQIQRQLVNALIIQSCLPFTALGLPIGYGCISVLFNYYNQSFMNIAMVTSSLHGILSTVVMICVHKPYRKAFIRLVISAKKWYDAKMNVNILQYG